MWVYGLIGLAQYRDRWQTLVSAVMNHQVPWNAGNFLTSCKPASCSRTLHHGVSKPFHCMYCIWILYTHLYRRQLKNKNEHLNWLYTTQSYRPFNWISTLHLLNILIIVSTRLFCLRTDEILLTLLMLQFHLYQSSMVCATPTISVIHG